MRCFSLCGYNSGYNIFYKDILYNFNALRAEQTKMWTHLDRLLEQLPIRYGL